VDNGDETKAVVLDSGSRRQQPRAKTLSSRGPARLIPKTPWQKEGEVCCKVFLIHVVV